MKLTSGQMSGPHPEKLPGFTAEVEGEGVWGGGGVLSKNSCVL